MANQLSGQTGPSPRCYRKHQRHATFARVKSGQDQFSTFLAAQGARLTQTSAAIFGKLPKNSAARIAKASTFGSLA